MSLDARMMSSVAYCRYYHEYAQYLSYLFTTGRINYDMYNEEMKDVGQSCYRHKVIREQMVANGYITKI